MPFRLTLIADLPRGARVDYAFGPAHRLACLLLEDRDSDPHDSQDKIFAIRPPWVPRGTSTLELAIHVMSDDLHIVDNARRRLATLPAADLNLGDREPLLQPVLQVSGVSWQQLAESEPRTVVRFETLSPVMFSRSGRSNPLPDPYLTVTQLVRRWNTHVEHSHLKVSEDWAKELATSTSIRSFDIRTQSLKVKGWKTGYVGEVSFSTSVDDVETQRLFSSIFNFAEFSGVGALTTQGLGAIQLLND